jgi:hypothetical protein
MLRAARAWLTMTLAGVALALGGCGSMRMVDTTVSTFHVPVAQDSAAAASSASNTPGVTTLQQAKRYWLERLPSQTSDAQQRMATMAHASLAGVGLQRAETRAQAQVLITLTTSQTDHDRAPFDDPTPRTGFWFGTAGSGISFQFGTPASSWYQRELHWVFRAPSGDVLQEIKALHDGRWSDDDTVWQAMLSASLTDFPNAPSDTRVIKSDIPR